MNRRRFLTSFAAAAGGSAALRILGGTVAAQATEQIINVVEAFGFVPDGRTDNHAAFVRWAEHANRRGGGNYLFPRGTYYVARHHGGGAPGQSPVERAALRGCDGLSIMGESAKILLNGNFRRSGAGAATMATFIPLQLIGCRNVTIRGFDIDGGVLQMRRDPSVTETYAHLVALEGCQNVHLEDLHLHHSQTDAITLTGGATIGPQKACRDVHLRRVKCFNNARGGMSIVQAYGVTSEDCEFSDSGVGVGPYGGHAPKFGVTVEPDYLPPNIDVRTGNIEFRRCTFRNNATAFSGVYANAVQGYLRVLDCHSSNAQASTYHITLNWPGALIEGGIHDIGEGTMWLSWSGQKEGHVVVRNCEIRTSAFYGVFHPFEGNLVEMEQVRVIGTHSKAASIGWVLALQGDPGRGRRNLLRDCEIFIPAARKNPAAAYDYEVSLFHTVSEGNLFRTDLLPVKGAHFCTHYGPRTIARGDHYRGMRPGRADSFRPGHLSDFDTRLPYSSSP